MSVLVVRRPPRAEPPPLPAEEVELAEPPVLGEAAQLDLTSAMTYLPMGLGTAAMVLVYSSGIGSTSAYVLSGAMGFSMISMSLGQMGRQFTERRRRMRAERRDYLRYLAQLRDRARAAATGQRTAVRWDNPDPAALESLVTGSRIWERRPGHPDFARVRIGVGEQRAALDFRPPATRPVEDLEPLTALALRRFIRTYRTAGAMPIAVGLRSFTAVEFAGDLGPALALARAMLGQLAALHSPDELRIAVLTEPAGEADWGWCKWLPHTAHPVLRDAAGPARLVAADLDSLFGLLGPGVTDRPDHDRTAAPSAVEPFVVIVAHRAALGDRTRLLAGGIRNVVLFDLTGALPGGPDTLRLTVTEDAVEFPSGGGTGSAVTDALSQAAAERLARALAPLRTNGTVDLVDKPLDSDFELTTLLGIRDAHRFDVPTQWRTRQPQRARLQVPIGVTEGGEVVELDLKESAQGGMGPHGVLIGATGSGKSELLRTLVVGLATTHSSEVLNLVLVDFKGGATFLGMDRLPHTSAVITNLADELPLVDRMQDSVNGELVRRQELLREHGHSSLYDYERARAGGAPLRPLPTLLVVVDEFSELLAAKPEFMDLFVQIGRLGRSLGVHLLLASQRLDEGRIHRVEGHLSYRIALRTFSAMESRSVIGVPSAYELPSSPGNGFLKIDTTNLVRFKAAYVSGACPPGGAGADGTRTAAGAGRTAVFGLRTGPLEATEPEETEAETPDAEPAGEGGQSLLDVLIDRLAGFGPRARQVWLPPLSVPPTLDELLPGIGPDPVRGMSAPGHPDTGTLRVAIGVVDRPFDQSRDLLRLDLSGAAGHVGLVGAPQSGKSTLLRTVMLSLALTHTPAEVQFYVVDLAGGGLVTVAGLPHVGSMATRLERDRVLRTVAELTALVERREQAFAEHGVDSMAGYRARRAEGRITDEHGDVFLVVDGWGTLRQDFPDLEPRVTELTARGLAFGVHVLVAANRWSEIRSATRDLLGTKLELRLGDPLESEFGGRVASAVPRQAGRGLTGAKEHFLGALPRMDGAPGTDGLAAATKTAAEEIAAFWAGPAVPPVRMLPVRLPAAELPPPRDARICLGLDEQRLRPVWHDFDATPHLMVFGDSATGKTNLLRLVARAVTARHDPGGARILLADTRRQLHDVVPPEYRVGYAIDQDSLADLARNAAVSVNRRMPGPDVDPARLARRDWWEGPELFLVVDDYDLLVSAAGMGGGPLEPLVPLLAHGRAVGMHLVIARSSSGGMRAMLDPLLRRLWELGNPGLLLSYPKEEGKFLGEAVPRTLPPGRAQLVTRRSVDLLQIGMVP